MSRAPFLGRPKSPQLEQEMVSLIPSEEQQQQRQRQSSNNNQRSTYRPPNSGDNNSNNNNSSWAGKMMKKRLTSSNINNNNEEERVSLLGSSSGDDNDNNVPGHKNRERRNSKDNKRKKRRNDDSWTMKKLLRYLSLSLFSATMTFIILGRQNKSVHWEEYKNILDPHVSKVEQRCFCDDECQQQNHQITDSIEKDERCTCPDPSVPLLNKDVLWKKHHDVMYSDALNAPQDLDIVFLGDSIIERLNGTRHFGTEEIPGLRSPFEKYFTKKGGPTALHGLALGSSGDIGPNVLWHLKNGILDQLRPKIWFILIGTNDLYEYKCIDRFVVANVLNVLKTISEQQPEAHFIVHGILPRTDKSNSKSQFLGQVWKRAQDVNFRLRKFCERKHNMHYMQGGPLFMEETDVRGRRQIDVNKMADGVHPTAAGLEAWVKYIVKEISKIMDDIQEVEKAKEGKNEAGRYNYRGKTQRLEGKHHKKSRKM